MASAYQPLKFPDHFPPTSRWKKFFIGIRLLGPDLSFFKELKAQQASRDQSQMESWGGGLCQEVAERVSFILCKRLRWSTTVFLPNDQFAVVCHGPRFDLIDDFALEEAIEDIERTYRISIPPTFWLGRESSSFGEVVNGIIELAAA